MADLDFISTISSTFIDEINKFITTFTSTIKTQFEDVESKMKAQELEINKLREELNSKKYEEKNYTSVSVIKNQDKQIHELNNTIKTLESRLKYLEQRTNSSKEPIKESNAIKSIIEDKKVIDIVVEHVEVTENSDNTNNTDNSDNTDNTNTNINTNINTNTDIIIEEKIVETLPEPSTVKKIVKKTSKKNSVEPVVEITTITTTIPEPITEKPKRKIAIKKNAKTELPISNESVEKDEKDVKENDTSEAERIEKENAEVDADAKLELETKPIETECIEAETIEKEKVNTSKTKKLDTKKEKEVKTSTSVKKEKETKKPVDIKKVKEVKGDAEATEVEELKVKSIEVKYPDTIPHLDSVNILEFDNIDYYLDELTNNVFQITPSEEIGAFIGVYDKDSKKIIKMSS